MRADGGLFGELWTIETRNRILMGIVALEAVCILYCLTIVSRQSSALGERKPLVERIDRNYRAYEVHPDEWELKATDVASWDPIIRQTFSEYVEKRYSLHRGSIKTDFADTLYFWDKTQTEKQIKRWAEDAEVKEFMQNATKPDVSAKATMITLYGLETGCRDAARPCEAVIEFKKSTEISSDVTASRKCRDTILFVRQKSVRDDQIRVNALGFNIVREDLSEAFQEEAGR